MNQTHIIILINENKCMSKSSQLKKKRHYIKDLLSQKLLQPQVNVATYIKKNK